VGFSVDLNISSLAGNRAPVFRTLVTILTVLTELPWLLI
jgi:hypothetical protein